MKTSSFWFTVIVALASGACSSQKAIHHKLVSENWRLDNVMIDGRLLLKEKADSVDLLDIKKMIAFPIDSLNKLLLDKSFVELEFNENSLNVLFSLFDSTIFLRSYHFKIDSRKVIHIYRNRSILDFQITEISDTALEIATKSQQKQIVFMFVPSRIEFVEIRQ